MDPGDGDKACRRRNCGASVSTQRSEDRSKVSPKAAVPLLGAGFTPIISAMMLYSSTFLKAGTLWSERERERRAARIGGFHVWRQERKRVFVENTGTWDSRVCPRQREGRTGAGMSSPCLARSAPPCHKRRTAWTVARGRSHGRPRTGTRSCFQIWTS